MGERRVNYLPLSLMILHSDGQWNDRFNISSLRGERRDKVSRPQTATFEEKEEKRTRIRSVRVPA